jgi:threonine/homoserine/homoserine lactone efflux protein
MDDPLLYLLAVLTLLGVPGPTNALLALAGAARGFLRSLPLLAAELLGYAVSIAVVGFVLAPVVADLQWLAVVLKLVVALYLLWLAVSLWRRGLGTAGGGGAIGPGTVFAATLLNPKGLALALGIVPWSDPNAGGFLAVLAAVILATGAAWIAGGAAIGAASKTRILLPKAGAVALAGFAGLLVASAFG